LQGSASIGQVAAPLLWEHCACVRKRARRPRRNTPTLRHARMGLVIRKLRSGKYRLYSRRLDPRTGRRRNLGTFDTRTAAEQHERAVQYFKRRG